MAQRQQQQFVLHSNVTDTTATIAVAGLSGSLRVLHLSDSHVSLASDHEPHSHRMHSAFFADGAGKADRSTGEMRLPRDRFEQQVAEASSNGADLLIHTGDLLNVCELQLRVSLFYTPQTQIYQHIFARRTEPLLPCHLYLTMNASHVASHAGTPTVPVSDRSRVHKKCG